MVVQSAKLINDQEALDLLLPFQTLSFAFLSVSSRIFELLHYMIFLGSSLHWQLLVNWNFFLGFFNSLLSLSSSLLDNCLLVDDNFFNSFFFVDVIFITTWHLFICHLQSYYSRYYGEIISSLTKTIVTGSHNSSFTWAHSWCVFFKKLHLLIKEIFLLSGQSDSMWLQHVLLYI